MTTKKKKASKSPRKARPSIRAKVNAATAQILFDAMSTDSDVIVGIGGPKNLYRVTSVCFSDVDVELVDVSVGELG